MSRASTKKRSANQPVFKELATVQAAPALSTLSWNRDMTDNNVPDRDGINPASPPATPQQDSGEVEFLSDGSISIPVLEEELVVTKRLVVRERIIVHRDTLVEKRHITANLRKERVAPEESDDDTHREA
jgi:hypothetical protein